MLTRLFPKQFDNTYQGQWLAIWLFVPVVLVKLLMGANVAGFNPWVDNRYVLRTADAIPIDSYGAEAASVVVFLFASWGLGLLLLSLLGVLALLRYRAMVPLMLLVMLIEQVGRKGISLVSPIMRAVESQGLSAGAMINWALTAALAVGLVLSLMPRKREQTVA
jgi:hypothetical protein